jgi:hypothetical protein
MYFSDPFFLFLQVLCVPAHPGSTPCPVPYSGVPRRVFCLMTVMTSRLSEYFVGTLADAPLSGARPPSLGGGRARLSADAGALMGGRESSPPGGGRRGTGLAHACIVRCGIAAAAPAPAVDSGSDRRVCRASSPKAGALQPPIGCDGSLGASSNHSVHDRGSR